MDCITKVKNFLLWTGNNCFAIPCGSYSYNSMPCRIYYGEPHGIGKPPGRHVFLGENEIIYHISSQKWDQLRINYLRIFTSCKHNSRSKVIKMHNQAISNPERVDQNDIQLGIIFFLWLGMELQMNLDKFLYQIIPGAKLDWYDPSKLYYEYYHFRDKYLEKKEGGGFLFFTRLDHGNQYRFYAKFLQTRNLPPSFSWPFPKEIALLIFKYLRKPKILRFISISKGVMRYFYTNPIILDIL